MGGPPEVGVLLSVKKRKHGQELAAWLAVVRAGGDRRPVRCVVSRNRQSESPERRSSLNDSSLGISICLIRSSE